MMYYMLFIIKCTGVYIVYVRVCVIKRFKFDKRQETRARDDRNIHLISEQRR